ncbi:MAG: TetR/AcrR family transcriptional regulator [Gordonia sp. (in: high G+C Gram-positive bacteria)]
MSTRKPSPQPAPRRARPADRKRQLAANAAALFLERGYPQVSVADVARAAGVTAPSVYRHFVDKQDLLAAAVLTGVDNLEDCTERALRGVPRPLPELVDTLCEFGIRHPESLSLWRWTSNYLTTEQNRHVVERTRRVLARWVAVVAIDRPELSERDCRLLAWATVSVAGSMSVHHTRMSGVRAHAELTTLIGRLLQLEPATALPLPTPTPISALTWTRRDEILDAAAQLFAARGYSDVGVDEIGAAVGITGPSVYKHFSSKFAVLLGICQRSAMRLEAGVLAAQSSTADPAKLLGMLVDSYVTVITATPDLSVAFNSSAVLAGQPAAVELLDIQRRYVRRWVDLLIQVSPDLRADQAAVAVHAALSIVNDAVQMRRGVQRPEFASHMAYLMKGILAV